MADYAVYRPEHHDDHSGRRLLAESALDLKGPFIESKRLYCKTYKHFFLAMGIDGTGASCDCPDSPARISCFRADLAYN
jgi:hypothetical protein